MKGVTSNRTMRFIVGPLPGLAIALGIAPAHAAAARCPPAVALRPRPECPAAISAPAGLPTHGGTITGYPRLPAPRGGALQDPAQGCNRHAAAGAASPARDPTRDRR